jgi:hypothetical protein
MANKGFAPKSLGMNSAKSTASKHVVPARVTIGDESDNRSGKPRNKQIKEITRRNMKIQRNGLCWLLCLGLSLAAASAFTGCAGNQYDRSTGQYIDDKSLTVRVHDALHDNSEYKFDNVNVNVFRGTVQLSGFVDNADQKTKAVEIAKGVQGVQNVEDSITVKSP